MDEEKEERRGFRVTDRRRFAESGEPRADTAPDAETPREEGRREPASPAGGAHAAPSRADEEPVSFSTFVLGLSTQALLHLGEIPDPVTNAIERDLGGAKQVIDLLGILREKTRNNLEPAEEALLDSVLYDLRLRYVELVQPSKEG